MASVVDAVEVTIDAAGDAVDLCVDGSRDEGEVMVGNANRETSPSPSRRDWP